jgi:heptosyltransferase-2
VRLLDTDLGHTYPGFESATRGRLVHERILCVKTHAIGATLMITPALRVLRRANPLAEIVVLAGTQCAEMLMGNPSVDEVIAVDDQKLQRVDRWEMVDLVRRLRRAGFHRAYIFEQSQGLHFLLSLTRIPHRVGLSYSPWAPFLTRRVVWPSGSRSYAGEMYLRVVGGRGSENAGALSVPISQRDATAAAKLLSDAGVGEGETLAALAPGGGRNPRDYVPQKRWQPGRFAEVADALAREYGCRVVLVGTPDDLPCLLAVAQQATTPVVNLCGQTALRTLAAVLARCHLLVTNDSAPLHVAVAVGTPSVTLFGPTDSTAALPPGATQHVGIQSSASCSPCYANEPFPGCETWICMEEIGVSEVLEAARRLLGDRCQPE